MQKLDHLLNQIGDGAWHSLKSLSKHSKIPEQKLENILNQLSQGNLIEYETKTGHVRIKKEWQQMLKTTGEEEPKKEKAAVGIVVLPPKKTISIQGIQVTNLTDKELELGVRIDKKLEELAIDIMN